MAVLNSSKSSGKEEGRGPGEKYGRSRREERVALGPVLPPLPLRPLGALPSDGAEPPLLPRNAVWFLDGCPCIEVVVLLLCST